MTYIFDGTVNSFRRVVDELNASHAQVQKQSEQLAQLRADLAAMTKERDAMREAIAEYIEKFDDESLSDKRVKAWLDSEWIPNVRVILASARNGDATQAKGA